MTVAIDDFGSGYSNMAYLTKIPADIIKIDKGFVQHVEPSGQSGFLLRKIAELACGLGFHVVGEGVETAEAYDFLKSIGCAQAQGYHISKPLPAGRITDWLDCPCRNAPKEDLIDSLKASHATDRQAALGRARCCTCERIFYAAASLNVGDGLQAVS